MPLPGPPYRGLASKRTSTPTGCIDRSFLCVSPQDFAISAPPRLGVADDVVGEVGQAVTDGLGGEEARGLRVAGLAEEALAGSEHDREDEQPQLVDQVVVHQRDPELV